MVKQIKSLEELAILGINGKVRVRVNYGQNGSRTDYICEVENDGSLKITTRIKPVGYSVESVFVDGHDIPETGMRIQERIMDTRGVYVEGHQGALIYGKTFEEAPKTAKALRAAIYKFVEDVVSAAKEVDRMAMQHIKSLSGGVPPNLEKYLNAG